MTTPTDFDSIRGKYLPLREAQRTLNKRLQTMLPKPAFKECGKKLGLWQHGQLVFDSEDDVAVLSDYMIYDYRLRGGTNAVERLRKLDEVKPGTAAHEVLEALQAARFTLLRAVQIVPGTGALVDDLFYGERHLLADITFSENSEPGVTMAARLLFIQDFVMTTGAALGIDPNFADDILETMSESYGDGFHDLIRSFGVAARSELAARLVQSVMAPKEQIA